VLYLSLSHLPSPILTMALSVQAQAVADGGSRWWLWLLLILLLSVVVAWLLGREGAGEATGANVAATPSPHPAEPPAATPTATRAPATTLVVESPAPEIKQPEPTPAPAPLQPVAAAEAAQPAVAPAPVAVAAAAQPTVAPAPVAVEPDDLTVVEGIGPKINSVLHAAGVLTFADLARADAGDLKKILVDAGLRLQNPASWPEQAALAAAGQWEELKALQGRLSAGRRN
jgi:predicted flap endonuclease-1-like 5' DNA nuclease